MSLPTRKNGTTCGFLHPCNVVRCRRDDRRMKVSFSKPKSVSAMEASTFLLHPVFHGLVPYPLQTRNGLDDGPTEVIDEMRIPHLPCKTFCWQKEASCFFTHLVCQTVHRPSCEAEEHMLPN